MEENFRIKELYRKLINNRITPSELDEFLDLLDRQDNNALTYAEMEVLWNRGLKVAVDDNIKNQIRSLQDRALEAKSRGYVSDTPSIKLINWRYLGGVAAGLLILLVVFYSLGVFHHEIEYHTDYGEREQITLPDGSIVELNANTTLVWNKKWKKDNIRKVKLDGEAFFEVIHTSDDATFIVLTDDLEVEVLGTAFNVSSRHQTTEVFLEEGSVRLGLKGENTDKVTMSPGQKVTYSKDRELIVEENVEDNVASWKNDILYFNDKTVEVILREVSVLYGVEFSYNDPEIKERKLNFWVPYSGWQVTKEAFELTMNLKLEEKDGVYEVGKK